MKGYNLRRHFHGQAGVDELEFESALHFTISRRKLGNFTASEPRALAAKMEQDARWKRNGADALEADAKQLRAFAYEMDPDAGADGKPSINGD